jgi:hypothetical protein
MKRINVSGVDPGQGFVSHGACIVVKEMLDNSSGYAAKTQFNIG